MKSVTIFFLLLLCAASFNAESQSTKTWAGGASGTWSTPANWSPVGTPVGNDTAIFNSDASVTMDVNVSLGALRIINNASVIFNAPGTRDITLYGTTQQSPALLVESGSTLTMTTGSSAFHMGFAIGAKAWINGTMICTGSSSSADARLQADVIGTNRIYINGTYLSDINSGNIYGDTRTLFFNAGSVFQLNDNSGTIPNANWDASSFIKLTGVTTAAPVFLTSGFSDTYYGNIEYDCPSQANDVNLSIATSSTYKSIVRGNMTIKNSNQKKVWLATNLRNFIVEGNFEVNGSNTQVSMGNGAFGVSVMEVKGDFILANMSNTFSMQDNSDGNDTLRIGGNITFNGKLISNSSNPGLLELNGISSQLISDTVFVQSLSNKINLKINNSNGVIYTASPLKMSGKLLLAAGVFKVSDIAGEGLNILNPTDNAIEGADANSYISGILTRSTNLANDYVFPVGRNGKYRPVTFTPSSSLASTYGVNYKDEDASGTASINTPLTSICNQEYWQVWHDGTNAPVIKLSLNGTVTASPNNPSATDSIVMAKAASSAWTKQTIIGDPIFPGNSISGNITSGPVSFSGVEEFITFGVVSGTLPIRLISFNATKKDNKTAIINWITDGLEAKGNFEVMKSTDGKNFFSVYNQKAILNKTDYSFTDNNLSAGISYYKLKMTDGDNKITWSDVKFIANSSSGLYIISVTPTIANSNVNIKISSDKSTKSSLLVYNNAGMQVKSLLITLGEGENNFSLDVSALAAGSYRIILSNENIKSGSVIFIKN